MVRKVNAFLITVCLLWAVEAKAITGDEWRQASEAEQLAYLAGVTDVWQFFREITSRAKDPSTLAERQMERAKCVAEMEMKLTQFRAVVKKFVDDNPARWHYSMSTLTWLAAVEVCKSMGK